MVNRRLYVLVAAVSCAACTGGPRWAGEVTDSAGVRIVANTAEGIWAPDRLDSRLQTDHRVQYGLALVTSS